MRLLKCVGTMLHTRLKSNLTSAENYKKLASWLNETEVLYGPCNANKSVDVSKEKKMNEKKVEKKVTKTDVDTQAKSYSKTLMKSKIKKNIDAVDKNEKNKTSSKKIKNESEENKTKTEQKTIKKSQLKENKSQKNKIDIKAKGKKSQISKQKIPKKETKISGINSKGEESSEVDEIDLKIARLMELPLEEDPDDEFHDFTLATPQEVAILTAQDTMSKSNINYNDDVSSQSDNDTPPNNDKEQFLKFISQQPLLPNSQEYKEQLFNFPKTAYLPSVSTILKNTMSPENVQVLNDWEKRMISQLGEKGFQDYKAQTFETGRLFHEYISSLLLTFQNTNIPLSQLLNTSSATQPDTNLITPPTHQNTTQQHQPVTIHPSIEKHIQSVKHVMSDVSNVVCIEKPVTHSALKYKGILDCIGDYDGVRCLVEWKTAKRKKSSIEYTYDNPLQIVAYMAAYNESLSRPQHLSSSSSSKQYLDNCSYASLETFQPSTSSSSSSSSSSFSSSSSSFSQTVSNGLIVVAYEDGSKADVHKMGAEFCSLVWSNWLSRLQLFWKQYEE